LPSSQRKSTKHLDRSSPQEIYSQSGQRIRDPTPPFSSPGLDLRQLQLEHGISPPPSTHTLAVNFTARAEHLRATIGWGKRAFPKSNEKHNGPGKGDCKSWPAQDRAAGGCRWDWRRRRSGERGATSVVARGQKGQAKITFCRLLEANVDTRSRPAGASPRQRRRHGMHAKTRSAGRAASHAGKKISSAPVMNHPRGLFSCSLFSGSSGVAFTLLLPTRGWGMRHPAQSQARPSNIRRPAVRPSPEDPPKGFKVYGPVRREATFGSSKRAGQPKLASSLLEAAAGSGRRAEGPRLLQVASRLHGPGVSAWRLPARTVITST
jgi:hypothetical protein